MYIKFWYTKLMYGEINTYRANISGHQNLQNSLYMVNECL